MNFTWWRYPARRFTIDGRKGVVVMKARLDGLVSELRLDGQVVAADRTPIGGPEAIRNHRLAAPLDGGRMLDVEAGYVSLWSIGVAARIDGALVHESHPGKTIAYPEDYREAVIAMKGDTLGQALKSSFKGDLAASQAAGYDPGRLARNKVPILVDIALGILFYIVAKLTDLPTAALFGAGAGLLLVVVQRFVKVDLLGGLAMFGIVMLLISAGLALAFQDDDAVKLRGTVVGLIGATLFLADGLLGGRRIGKALSRYTPYSDIDTSRLAIGMGLLGLVMAGLNYLVARFASTDVWLLYSTFFDFVVTAALAMLVFHFARGKMLARGYRPPSSDER